MKEFEEVTLLDEDGKECRFTHLATIEHEGSYYIALEPLDDPKAAPPEDLELEDDEEVLTVMLLKINMNEDEDGQDAYELVEDDDLAEILLDKLDDILYEQEMDGDLDEDEEEEEEEEEEDGEE